MTGRYTCFAMYNGTASGLAAEDYSFIDKTMERPTQRTLYYHDLFPQGMKKYLLRPETVESLYVMYAKTKNPVFGSGDGRFGRPSRKSASPRMDTPFTVESI